MLAATLAAQAQVTLYAYRNTQLDDVQNAKKGPVKFSPSDPSDVTLIADQTPGWPEIQNWTLFLGQWTPFFMGMEKLALKFHMPVVFLDVHKVRRGYYEARFDLIYDGDEAVDEGEITRRYAERLEQMIRTRPELWMWSHRRWKHDMENWMARHPHAQKIADQMHGQGTQQ